VLAPRQRPNTENTTAEASPTQYYTWYADDLVIEAISSGVTEETYLYCRDQIRFR
jgi:hypothetical protein